MYLRPSDRMESKSSDERDLPDSEDSLKWWQAVRVKMFTITWPCVALAAMEDRVQWSHKEWKRLLLVNSQVFIISLLRLWICVVHCSTHFCCSLSWETRTGVLPTLTTGNSGDVRMKSLKSNLFTCHVNLIIRNQFKKDKSEKKKKCWFFFEAILSQFYGESWQNF